MHLISKELLDFYPTKTIFLKVLSNSKDWLISYLGMLHEYGINNRLILGIKNIALNCALTLILINIILLTISHFEQGHHIHYIFVHQALSAKFVLNYYDINVQAHI